MKNSILFLSFFSLLILGSCGTSYYSSSGYEDGIYYQPSSSRNELISAENKQLAELTKQTRERSTEIVSRNDVEIIRAEDGAADVNVDLNEDKTYLVVMDDESYEERFERFDDGNFNFSINLVVDSPWWYDTWYCNPWHYRARWSYAWHNPWYCGWYDPWYSPWYGPHYAWGGWYDPWYSPWYGPHYAWGGWYDPWYGPYPYPTYPVAYRNVVYGRRDAANSGLAHRTSSGATAQRYSQRQSPTINRTRGGRTGGLDDNFLPTSTVVAPTTEVNRRPGGARRASSYDGITRQNENNYVNSSSRRRAIANGSSSSSNTASRNPMYRKPSGNSSTRSSAYVNSNGSSIRRSVSSSTGRSTGSSFSGRTGSRMDSGSSYNSSRSNGSTRSSYNSSRSSYSGRSAYSSPGSSSGRSSYSSGSYSGGRSSGFSGGGGYSGGGRSGGGGRR